MFGFALFQESTMLFVAATVVSWYASDWKVSVTLLVGGVGARRRGAAGQRERRGDDAGDRDARTGAGWFFALLSLFRCVVRVGSEVGTNP